MKVRSLHTAATLTFGFALTGMVVAQGPPQTPQQPKPQTQQTMPHQQGLDRLKSMDGQTVTLTGCLTQEQGRSGQATTPAGDPQTPRAGAAAGQDFVLTNVQMRSASPTTGAPGTPGSPETGAAPGARTAGSENVKVKLSSSDNSQMRGNVDQQVEVTGRLEIEDDRKKGAEAQPQTQRPSTMPPTTHGTAGHMDSMPELHVTSVRATGKPCSASQQ